MAESNRFIGFMVILLVGGLISNLLLAGLNTPEVIEELGKIHPWFSDNSETLGYISFGIVAFIFISIPPILLLKEGGAEKVERIGETGKIMFFTACSLAAIPAMAYLLGIGWFSAKHSLGL